MGQEWRSYEKIANHILNALREHLGLSGVEGKQKLPGITGTEWEIDAKGVREEDGGIVLIECRRYPKKRQSQEQMAGLAFRIEDTGAKGGILVSPIEPQLGAKKVAQAKNILFVKIDENSTVDNFAAEFLNKLCIGMTLHAGTVRLKTTPTLSKRCKTCGKTFIVKTNEDICEQCNNFDLPTNDLE